MKVLWLTVAREMLRVLGNPSSFILRNSILISGTKKKGKIGQVWWHSSLKPSTLEAEAGEGDW